MSRLVCEKARPTLSFPGVKDRPRSPYTCAEAVDIPATRTKPAMDNRRASQSNRKRTKAPAQEVRYGRTVSGHTGPGHPPGVADHPGRRNRCTHDHEYPGIPVDQHPQGV